MKKVQTDVAIIGAGTAGLAAYRAAKAAGASAVVIEGGEQGTTCARVGCMPSKLLIAAADAAHHARNAGGFGVHADGLRVDGAEVMDRVRSERDRFVDFVLRDIAEMPSAERFCGHATFIDDHSVQVGDHTRIEAKSIVIATGSQPVISDACRALADRVIVNDDVFNWRTLPESVAVIGPGIIGLELGQALHRLGVRVAVFGRGGRVGPLGDPKVLACAVSTFRNEFSLEPDARIVSMQQDEKGVAIRRAGSDGHEKTEHFEFVLAATGRAPCVAELGLRQTSLKLDAKGVPEFDAHTAQAHGQTAPSSIFIAGDASNFIPLLHEAADEGRIAGNNAARLALGKSVEKGLRRARLAVVFSDPQIAIVGAGFKSLAPRTFATGVASFENQGRSRILMQNKGLIHVYACLATGRLLGAEMLAPAAEHLAHLLAWALQSQMTVGQMLDMPFYHPVIEEGLRTALRDANLKLLDLHRRPPSGMPAPLQACSAIL